MIDIAIYGNAKFSSYSFFDVETPICYEEYENISTIADYHPFEFDDDWKDAMLNKAVGKKITDYCDGSYRAVIWDFICDFLTAELCISQEENVKTAKEITRLITQFIRSRISCGNSLSIVR